jgi:hypothetical protein
MLAAAVWNEDEIGAVEYREALIRWPEVSSYQRESRVDLVNRRLLFPDIVHMNWSDAAAHVRPNLPAYVNEPAPVELFSSLLHETHRDCIVLTAATLLAWHMESKLASDIGARTAVALLRREVVDAGSRVRHQQQTGFHFRSVFLDIIRIELAGERFRDNGYGNELDRLVSSLDAMSERPVVPGRIYTPSTKHDREELRAAFLATLLATVPSEGDDGIDQRLRKLLQNEAALPNGDGSVRNLLQLLETFHRILDSDAAVLRRGVSGLSATVKFETAVAALKAIVETSLATIRGHRSERLEKQPVDPAKIEQIRSALDEALLTPPAAIPFFRGFALSGGTDTAGEDVAEFDLAGIAKGELVAPPHGVGTGKLC